MFDEVISAWAISSRALPGNVLSYSDSKLQLRTIQTDPDTDGGNLGFTVEGTISIASSGDYTPLVIDDLKILPISIYSISRVGGTVTVVTSAAHGISNGDNIALYCSTFPLFTDMSIGTVSYLTSVSFTYQATGADFAVTTAAGYVLRNSVIAPKIIPSIGAVQLYSRSLVNAAINKFTTNHIEDQDSSIIITDATTIGSGASSIKFTVNGGEKVRIDANGRLGIGLDNPEYPLDVIATEVRIQGGVADVKAYIGPQSSIGYLYGSLTEIGLKSDTTGASVLLSKSSSSQYLKLNAGTGNSTLEMWTTGVKRSAVDQTGRFFINNATGVSQLNVSSSFDQVSTGHAELVTLTSTVSGALLPSKHIRISSTGEFELTNNANATAILKIADNGLTTLTGALVVVDSITTPSTTFNLLNATATTVNFAGAATAVNIGSTLPGTTTVHHDLVVTGNITFGSGATQMSATVITVDDTLIYLADNNTADILDIGFFGSYIAGSHNHTGMVRDANDKVWKFFSGVSSEPTGNVMDFTNAVYDDIKIGRLFAASAAVTGDVSAATGTFSGSVSGTTGTFSSAVSGTTGTFSSSVSGTSGTFSSSVSGTSGTFSGAVSGTSGTFSGAVSGTTGTFTGAVSGTTGTFTGALSSSVGVSGTTGTFTSAVSGTTGTFTGALSSSVGVSGTTGTFTGAVSGTTGTFTGALTAAGVSGTTGTFTSALTAAGATFTGDVVGITPAMVGVYTKAETNAAATTAANAAAAVILTGITDGSVSVTINSNIDLANATGILPVASGGTGVAIKTGTGSVVLSTSPTLITPTLGSATATTINKVAITIPTNNATLTIANGSSLITAGAFGLTLTSTAATNATFPAGLVNVGYIDLPQVIQAATATTTLDDVGKHWFHTGTSDVVYTIDNTVEFPIGSVLTFINDSEAGIVTIALTGGTMIQAGVGVVATGSVALAASGIATTIKTDASKWLINGVGLGTGTTPAAPVTPASAPLSYVDNVGTTTSNTSTASTTDDNTPGINIGDVTDTPKLYANTVYVPATYASGVLTPDSAMADNTYAFTYTLSNAGGESGKSPEINITIDTAIAPPSTSFDVVGYGTDTKGYWLGTAGDGTSKLIVAPISTEVTRAWGSYGTVRGTTNTSDGITNTTTLFKLGSAAHPAAYYARALTTGGYSNWYLPAKDELMTCWSNKLATPFATANAFVGSIYRSSTEENGTNAWLQNFDNGAQYTDVKSFNTYVRASRRYDPLAATTAIGGGSDISGYWLGTAGDGTSKLIVAPQSTEVIRAWGSEGTARGTTSTTNGIANTTTLFNLGSAAHPAAYYCRALSTGGYSNWYLPAKNELNTCWTNHLATPFATANAFGETSYWASTEFNGKYAWAQHFINGGLGYNTKSGGGTTDYIRAVRRTTL
jgi:hypothetical protein